MNDVPPIRREVLVAADPEVAFEVFAEQIGTWWPLAEFGIHGTGTVAFEDGALVERSADGEVARWGTVTDWRRPERLSFSWHPGADASRASYVTVVFTAHGDQTLVTLQHDGWEALADPLAAREEYDHGWPAVLSRYQSAVGDPADRDQPADRDSTDDTWVALIHRPADGAGAGVFGDDRFAEHMAFLRRMYDRGYLVAAGPLEDEPGAGMTVLKLPGTDRSAEAATLATTEDRSVVAGLFSVEVRSWNVQLTGQR